MFIVCEAVGAVGAVARSVVVAWVVTSEVDSIVVSLNGQLAVSGSSQT